MMGYQALFSQPACPLVDITVAGRRPSCRHPLTMESLGYKVVLCEGIPSEEIIEAVEQLAQRGSQCHWRPRENPTVCYLEGGRECEAFLHHQANVGASSVESGVRAYTD